MCGGEGGSVNFEYYRIFYYVAKCGSLTQAAHALMNNQPNISRVISAMESELGCRLLIREHRGVRLTPEGEQLFAHVRPAVEQLQEGEAALRREMGPARGTVTIGASETALHVWLLPVLRGFHEQYPQIRLRIANHTTPQALRALRSGEIDLAVAVTPMHDEGTLRRTMLSPVSDVLIGGEAYFSLAGRQNTLADIDGYPLIGLARETTTHAFLAAFYAEHGLTMTPDIEVGTADLILPMVKNQLGMGYLPREMARTAIEEGCVRQIPLKEAIPTRSICLVEDAQHRLSASAHLLKRVLLEHAVRQA